MLSKPPPNNRAIGLSFCFKPLTQSDVASTGSIFSFMSMYSGSSLYVNSAELKSSLELGLLWQ